MRLQAAVSGKERIGALSTYDVGTETTKKAMSITIESLGNNALQTIQGRKTVKGTWKNYNNVVQLKW